MFLYLLSQDFIRRLCSQIIKTALNHQGQCRMCMCRVGVYRVLGVSVKENERKKFGI